MSAKHRRLWCSLLFLGLFGLPTPLAAQAPPAKKPLTVEDLYRFDSPRSGVLFPGGEKAAYIRTWIDADTKQERNALWLVEGTRENRKALEPDGPDARSPVVSPDGKWIAFLSTRARPKFWKTIPATPPQSDPGVDLWLIPAGGGSAIPLAGPDKPFGRVFNDGFYGRLAFSPDGTKLAFIADDGEDPRTLAETANGVEIVRPDQGEGYTGYGTAQLWIAHLDSFSTSLAAKSIERLTNDDVWYGDPQWAPDGRSLVVHANKTAERESVRFSINRNFDLWSIDVATRKWRQLTFGPGPDVSPRFSPNGKQLAYLSIPRRGSHRDTFNLAVLTFGEGGAHARVLFDHHGPAPRKPPHDPPTFPLPEDCWHGSEHIAINCEVGTESRSERIEISTAARLDLPPATAATSDTVFARQRRRQTLTPPGNTFLNERLSAESKSIRWKNEGHVIEGIVTLPPAEVAKAPYKLIVHPHGGPHGRSALGFDFTVQLFAAHGYAVFQPNFRGSAGYGQKFIDADRFDFGGGDMRDILTGIDQLVRDGVVDPRRQFVYGTSYGGYMTTWLVGQTSQFRAAVAQNAVTDLSMMWALSDLQSWTEWEFGGLPWEVPERYRDRSPLTHAGNVRTPTLILHARDDRRCPLPMGRAFHQALLARGVPTQLIIYPDEGHGIRQPRHREDVLRRVLAWFEKHGE